MPEDHITEKERNRYCSKRLKKDYIDRISEAMTAERGSQHIQTRLFPRMFASLLALLDEELELTDIECTERSIILLSGELLFQVYDKKIWDTLFATSHLPLIDKHSEMKENQMCFFKVGMAFQIENHFVLFNTSDFILQCWETPTIVHN
ncbi:hypothetical protein PENSPDRAFT_670901 [Peniophora sp. CONT]|nr:hypothetical protein PENSPDRAFT_670901 [Peniophora sp. CONT]